MDTANTDNNETLFVLKEAIQEGLVPWGVERAATGGADPKLYYGALSVAVLTLGLLLLVEACRRQLDHSATGRPFFQHVLEGVYRELATLGVVELFIHLLQEYSSSLDVNKKALFADVHYLLFYTALFNACQSVIMNMVVKRVSDRMWVQTEELELHHYVEIREEFDRVRKQLYGEPAPLQDHDAINEHQSAELYIADEEGAQERFGGIKGMDSFRVLTFEEDQSCWKAVRNSCVGFIQSPRLKAKYNNLLVQVRFHEMRVHFLQAYDLPLKLKVSNYLMRSEQNVLKHLIHVSTSAWLWLVALTNVLYFITGMVADFTGESSSTETTLSIFFMACMVLFLIISLLVWRHMELIFMKIMEMKYLWDFSGQEPSAGTYNVSATASIRSTKYQHPALASEQLGLFFLGDPHLVVSAVQFMQFGYAISLSLCVVFWEDMNTGGHFPAQIYLEVTLVCYVFFVVVVSRILPKYTLCTSLGQLVDKKRLHETVALFRLEEAERRRQQHKEGNVYKLSKKEYPHTNQQYTQQLQQIDPEQHSTSIHQHQLPSAGQNSANGDALPLKSPDGRHIKGREDSEAVHGKMPSTEPPIIPIRSTGANLKGSASNMATDANGLSLTAVPAAKQSAAPALPAITEQETIHPEKATLLADLVKMDTNSLRKAIPLAEIRTAEATSRRRNRRKSVSDGVALMGQLGNFGKMSDAAGHFLTEKPKKAAPVEPLNKPPVEEHRNSKFAVDDSALVKRRERRRNRKKAVSASAAVREMREMTEAEENEGKAAVPIKHSGFWKTDPSKIVPPTEEAGENYRARRNRKKAVSASAAVRDMREMTEPEENEGKTAVPMKRADLWKTDSLKVFPPAEEANANYKPKSSLFQKPLKLFASTDDSATAAEAAKERRERRQNRRKSLSASAAVQLMQDVYPDEETGKLSRNDFWALSQADRHETVHEGDEEDHDDGEANAENGLPNNPRRLQTHTTDDAFHSDAKNKLRLSPGKEGSAHAAGYSGNLDNWQGLATLPNGETNPSYSLSENPNEDQINDASQYDEGGTDDEDSFDTAGSVGGLSDVDDIHDTPCFHEEEYDGGLSFCELVAEANDSVRVFLRSDTYSFVTHMMGTMICFFLIGMRVEGFLQEQCIIPSDDHSWDLELNHSFWLIVGFISAFIGVSIWIALLFPPCVNRYRDDNEDRDIESKREQWTVFLAAIIDIMICGSCLGLFLGAEVRRCCSGGDDHSEKDHSTTYSSSIAAAEDPYRRFLAEVTDNAEDHECYDKTLTCKCPVFGTRLEGSVGAIEPFTSLVGLRVFRFILARRIVQHMGLGDDYEEIKRKECNYGKHRGGDHKSQHGAATTTDHGGGNVESGTIVELWQVAIAKYPDIVEKYGEFSGELLQTMLGLDVIQQEPHFSDSKHSSDNLNLPVSPKSRDGVNVENAQAAGQVNDSITLDRKKYSKLSTEAQEIIAAGKVGMPCRAKSSIDLKGMASREPSSHNLGDIDGDEQQSSKPMEFEVDVAQLELDKLESNSSFEFPNARVVRSMRRCERKLLPLLEKWTVVDVVMTKHEIVYVHVSESDGSENAQQVKEAGQQALKATKGGKGLRLCDVVAGRRVIGQLSLADISSVFVEREHCHPSTEAKSGEEDAPNNHGHVEFWQDPEENPHKISHAEMKKRWDSVNRDSLKIQTMHGTLYLRFCSDLEDSEGHRERINELDIGKPIYKDIAMQWAQTILHQCSLEQLKQPLPHYGTNDNDELRDLLQIVHREEKHKHRRLTSGVLRWNPNNTTKHNRGKSSLGAGELGGLPLFETDQNVSADDNSMNPLKNGSSPSPGTPRIPRAKKITRFGSYHEDDVEPLSQASGDDNGRALSIG